MKKLLSLGLLAGLLTFASGTCIAQLSEYNLDGSKAFRIALYGGNVRNQWSLADPSVSFSTVLIDISSARSTFAPLKLQSSHRYKFLGDIVSLIYSGSIINPEDGTPSLTSFAGWHNFTLSVLSTQHVQVALGGHAGDYFYGVEGVSPHRVNEQNTNGSTYYYVGVGPAMIMDFSLGTTGFFLHYEGSYAYTFGETPLAPDMRPNVINQSIDLRRKNLFLNLELVKGLNPTGNRIARRQLGVGISI